MRQQCDYFAQFWINFFFALRMRVALASLQLFFKEEYDLQAFIRSGLRGQVYRLLLGRIQQEYASHASSDGHHVSSLGERMISVLRDYK